MFDLMMSRIIYNDDYDGTIRKFNPYSICAIESTNFSFLNNNNNNDHQTNHVNQNKNKHSMSL